MDKLNICVFFSKLDDNIKSLESASFILNALNSDKYTTIPVFINEKGQWFLYDGSIGSILDIDIERVGTKTILSPDTDHKGLLRLVLDRKKIIPIDLAISVVFNKMQEVAIRSTLEIAQIPFIGSDAFSYSTINDYYLKSLVAKDNDINMIKTLGYNCTLEPSDIYANIKENFSKKVVIKSSENAFYHNTYTAKKKSDIIDSLQKSFLCTKNIVVHEENNYDKVSIVFINKNNSVDLFPPVLVQNDAYKQIDLKEDILEKVQSVCIKLIDLFSVKDVCVITLLIDNKSGEVYFYDIDTNLLMTKDDIIVNVLAQNDVSVKEFLDTLLEWSIINE